MVNFVSQRLYYKSKNSKFYYNIHTVSTSGRPGSMIEFFFLKSVSIIIIIIIIIIIKDQRPECFSNLSSFDPSVSSCS